MFRAPSIEDGECVNFAFITRDRVPQAPPNPVSSTAATFTPDPARDLFMRSGDHISVTLHDTVHGLRIDLADRSTPQSGFMIASAANGVGQVKFGPLAFNGMHEHPLRFHPMYSTTSPQPRVAWAAHNHNIAYSDEIGHFDYCSNVGHSGACAAGATEGAPTATEPTDADDVGCSPASASLLAQVSGWIGWNVPCLAVSSFGCPSQYGDYTHEYYTDLGRTPFQKSNDFRQILNVNPGRAGPDDRQCRSRVAQRTRPAVSVNQDLWIRIP